MKKEPEKKLPVKVEQKVESEKEVQKEELKKESMQEKYGIHSWESKVENMTYSMTITFEDDLKGTFDYKVVSDETGEVVEEVKGATFTLDTETRAYFSYTDQYSEEVKGAIDFKGETVDMSIYRSTVTFHKSQQ